MSIQPEHRPPERDPHLQAVAVPAGEAGPSPEVQESAMWFFWLIGLSVANTVVGMLGMDLVFIFGLGVTQVFEVMAVGLFGDTGYFAAMVPNVFVLAYFGLMGFFALRGHVWAFAAGMIAYAADALLLLVFADWLSVAVHGYVLFRLGQGLMACFRR